jgi:hypothetical protein
MGYTWAKHGQFFMAHEWEMSSCPDIGHEPMAHAWPLVRVLLHESPFADMEYLICFLFRNKQ